MAGNLPIDVPDEFLGPSPQAEWARDAADVTPPADLPEGQQPRVCDALCRDVEEDRDRLATEVEQLREDRAKLTATIAAFPDAHNAANLAHARVERDRLRAEVARVRADAWADALSVVESAEVESSDPDTRRAIEAFQQALVTGLRIGGRIVARPRPPAESVVGAPTPIAAVSDLVAPRDALTDKDFAALNAAVAECRALPEDEGTRRLPDGTPVVWMETVAPNEPARSRSGRIVDFDAGRGEYRVAAADQSRSWVHPNLISRLSPVAEGTRQEGLINGD